MNNLTVSFLYSIEPVGIGTSFVESLTSYISRLADAHSVLTGTLVNNQISPVINKKYLLNTAIYGGSRFYESASALNSVGKIARDWVNALELLTLQTELSLTTLLPWNDVLPTRRLVRKHRAWCPSCINECNEQGRVLYEPLIWNLEVLQICPVHSVKLVKVCPKCKRTNMLLNRKSKPGYCSVCGAWLGSESLDKEDSKPKHEVDDWNIFVARSLCALFALSPNVYPDPKIVTFNINRAIELYSAGSTTGMARFLGIPKSTVKVWREGKNRPSLEALLHISFLTGVPFEGWFSKDICLSSTENFRTARNQYTQPIKRKRRTFDALSVKHQLKIILLSNETPPPSMREVARRIGYDKKILYRHFPEQCKAISARYIVTVSSAKVRRIEARSKLVKEVANSLFYKGVYPSRRKVEAYIPEIILREKEMKEAWHSIFYHN